MENDPVSRPNGAGSAVVVADGHLARDVGADVVPLDDHPRADKQVKPDTVSADDVSFGSGRPTDLGVHRVGVGNARSLVTKGRRAVGLEPNEIALNQSVLNRVRR